MTELIWKLEPKNIEWEMDWTNSKRNGYAADKPDKEMVFEDAKALAHLLMNDVIFLNDHWWEDDWPENAKKITSLNVNCNDVFAWGCADAEELPYKEIENLYRMWKKDPVWGPAVWCMTRRNEMPQKPVEDAMRKAGIWDLDSLKLNKNVTDDQVSAIFAGKPINS